MFVKWEGYSDAINSWVPLADVEQLAISASNTRGSLEQEVAKTVHSFRGISEDWEEWMWKNNSHLQPPAAAQLVGLQSLVRFWKEPPLTGVQGTSKRTRGWFE